MRQLQEFINSSKLLKLKCIFRLISLQPQDVLAVAKWAHHYLIKDFNPFEILYTVNVMLHHFWWKVNLNFNQDFHNMVGCVWIKHVWFSLFCRENMKAYFQHRVSNAIFCVYLLGLQWGKINFFFNEKKLFLSQHVFPYLCKCLIILP